MNVLVIFGTQLFLSLVVYTLIARWYVSPWLADKPLNTALILLILPHTIRHIGLTFLVPGVVGGVLPEGFAVAAAYGDFISGLLAILAVVALKGRWSLAIPLVWVFNIVGTVDLLNALRHADVVPDLGGVWYIPTFLVPLLLVTHFMVFARLLKRNQNASLTQFSRPEAQS
jgi:hypothetical protein